MAFFHSLVIENLYSSVYLFSYTARSTGGLVWFGGTSLDHQEHNLSVPSKTFLDELEMKFANYYF